MKRLTLSIILAFTFFSKCFATTAISVESFAIYPKGAENFVVRFITDARQSIDASFYQIKSGEIKEALLHLLKDRQGQVRVIIEEEPFKHAFNQDNSQEKILPELQEAGMKTYPRPGYLRQQFPKGHYHAKFMISDDSKILITTGNFDWPTFNHCRDFAVVFNKGVHPNEFRIIRNIFEKDLRSEPLTIQEIEEIENHPCIIVGPFKQREKIINFLKTAKHTIKIYQQYCNDPAISGVLKDLIAAGIKIDLVMMPYPTGNYEKDPNAQTQDFLAENGVNVRLNLNYYMHGRLVIIDDKNALIGTTQMSPPSLDENRELGIIVTGDVVGAFVKQFEADLKETHSLKEGRAIALEKKHNWSAGFPKKRHT